MTDRNPQAAQMADESMVRNLAAQIEAIWPQEREILRAALAARPPRRILDVACGTGEASARVLELFPEATLVGVDVDEAHLARARERCARHGGRAEFRAGDAFALDAGDGSFDLVLCRHLLQAVPEPQRVVAELARACAPGGRVHLVAEDYALMQFHPVAVDTDDFWQRGPTVYARALGTDLRVGRKAPVLLAEAGLVEIACDYVIVDTLRVPRPIFGAIWRAWRDGYAEAIAAQTTLTVAEVERAFAEMIACIEGTGYAVWHVPVVAARKP